nr:odorant receptor 9a-like [Megalopta genalis]
MYLLSDLRDAIGWNRFNLRIVGIWPEPAMLHERIADLRAFASVLFIMIFATIWQSVDLFMVNNDLSQITSILSLANIPAYNSAIKLLFVWYYRKDLQPLMKSFYDDWHAPKTEDERKTMVDSAKLCKNLSIWCTVLTQSMLVAYVGTRSFAIATCDVNAVQEDHLTIYPAYYPFDMRRTPFRVAANVGQVIAAYCALIPYTAVDIFIATLVLHTCGQFTNLNKRLAKLMDGRNGIRKSSDIREELASIVKRHEHLNWVAGRIDGCFSLLLFVQMLLSTVEICFQGFLFFNVILKSNDGMLNFQMLFFVLFISFIIVHMYVYCYVGELLRVQSSNMAIAAYDTNWYNVAPPEAKCLIFIMLRSMRPLCLTAGKFGIFSMEMFSTILRTAMGYLSVLVTVSSFDD